MVHHCFHYNSQRDLKDAAISPEVSHSKRNTIKWKSPAALVLRRAGPFTV